MDSTAKKISLALLCALFFLPLSLGAITAVRGCVFSPTNVTFEATSISFYDSKYWGGSNYTAISTMGVSLLDPDVNDGSNCINVLEKTKTGLMAGVEKTLIDFIPKHFTGVACENCADRHVAVLGLVKDTSTNLYLYDPDGNTVISTIMSVVNRHVFDIAVIDGHRFAVLSSPFDPDGGGNGAAKYPVSDVATGSFEDTTGGDSDGALWDELDESGSCDGATTYTRSGLPTGGVGTDTFTVNMAPFASSTFPVTFNVCARSSANGGEKVDILAEVLNPDSSVVCSIEQTNLNQNFDTYTTTCNSALFDDFANIDVKITVDDNRPPNQNRQVDVSWIEMVVPGNVTVDILDYSGNVHQSTTVSSDARALTTDGHNWWVANNTTNELEIYNINGRLIHTETLSRSVDNIDFDGRNLHVLYNSDNAVSILELD